MSRRSNVDARLLCAALAAVLFGAGIKMVVAQETTSEKPSQAAVEEYVRGMWPKVEPGWEARLPQDETQATCSRYRNNPPEADGAAIMKREAATIVFPADSNVSGGNWKEGEKVAQNGRGGQFSDGADVVNGGNCYACHQLARTELSYGTLGPSLTEYGKLREFSPEAAKEAFAKIYNPQATFACSNMPRFGAHKFLTEQQIRDVVAYLFDPESPVNK